MTARASPLGVGAGTTTSRRRPLAGTSRGAISTWLWSARCCRSRASGCLMVYSSTRQALAAAGVDPHYYLKRQALNLAIGAVLRSS